MSRSVLALVLLLFGTSMASAAGAPRASTAQCKRIADVSVPYTVSVGPTAIRFADKGSNITVTNDTIQDGTRTFQNPAVKNYYVALRSFLGNSGSMANVARSFMHRSAFPQAATSMCQSILAVDASSNALAQIFPDFKSPVQVKLN